MLEAIDHINLVVRDSERMTRFYTEALGLKITKQVTISGSWIDDTVGLRGVVGEVVYLDFPGGGPRIELIRYVNPTGSIAPGQELPNTPGIRHLAFRVAEIDTARHRLAAAGIRFLSEIQTVPDTQVTYAGNVRKRLVYFHDPEGNLLEICEYKSQGEVKFEV
jgi:catechol 2,3-dioxygenase-like lactoylglutathione lyase family enzyme